MQKLLTLAILTCAVGNGGLRLAVQRHLVLMRRWVRCDMGRSVRHGF